MASRSVAGHSIPGIIWLIFWVVIVILAIILLGLLVHWLGGGILHLKLGHFVLDIGFN